jgi:acetylornithine deacetylase/succinyl-diaminopimelate desuccinylase-like protein
MGLSGGIRVTYRRVEPNDPHYTSDPRTIWALPESARSEAVTDIFRQASVLYADATARNNIKEAQEAAIPAINVLAGLFPDREDPAHKLIAALLGALIAARSGSNRHILLRPGLRVPGTKGGFGAACIAAGGVAAVNALFSRGMSKRKARETVAKILTDNGYSRKNGDHGEPLPVTASALRAWEERPADNPLVVAIAPQYLQFIEEKIAEQGLCKADEVVGLIGALAPEFLQNHIAL